MKNLLDRISIISLSVLLRLPEPWSGRIRGLLYDRWSRRFDRETGHWSGGYSRYWLFKPLVSLGPTCIPLLVRDLKDDNSRPWWRMEVLRAICLENYLTPATIQPEDRGILDRVVAAWLSWAKENGFT